MVKYKKGVILWAVIQVTDVNTNMNANTDAAAAAEDPVSFRHCCFFTVSEAEAFSAADAGNI